MSDNQPSQYNLRCASTTTLGSSPNRSRNVSKYALRNIAILFEFRIFEGKPLSEKHSILDTNQVGSSARSISTSLVSAASQETGWSLRDYKVISFNSKLDGKPHTKSPSVGGQCANNSRTKYTTKRPQVMIPVCGIV